MGGQQHTPQSPQVGEVAVPVGQQRQDPAQQPFFQVVRLVSDQCCCNLNLNMQSIQQFDDCYS